MAFYKDIQSKTRQEKRRQAAARGGFEDEGAGYGKGGRSGAPRGSRAQGQARPAG